MWQYLLKRNRKIVISLPTFSIICLYHMLKVVISTELCEAVKLTSAETTHRFSILRNQKNYYSGKGKPRCVVFKIVCTKFVHLSYEFVHMNTFVTY